MEITHCDHRHLITEFYKVNYAILTVQNEENSIHIAGLVVYLATYSVSLINIRPFFTLKATVNLSSSSVREYLSDSNRTEYHAVAYYGFLITLVDTTRFWLKSAKNNKS